MPESLHYCDDVIEIATSGRVFGNRWFSRPSLEALLILIEYQRKFVATLGDGRHVVLSVLEASAGLRVDEATRKQATELAAEMQPHTIALGQLVRGSGFFASATRAVLSGVLLAARPGYPMRVFAEQSECSEWLAQQLASAYPATRPGDVQSVLAKLQR